VAEVEIMGPGDSLVLVGSHAEIDRAFDYLDAAGAAASGQAAPAPGPPAR
jgi:hypothetical protein